MNREELIAKLNKKEVPQSYSSLKHFTSPVDYLDYKLNKKKTSNAGMKFGSVCDVLLLTPDEFESRYAVVSEMPTTKNQEAFIEDLLCGFSFNDAYEKNYKNSAQFENCKKLLRYAEAIKAGKEAIDTETYIEAQRLTEDLLKYDDVNALFEQMTGAQQYIQWNEGGWLMRGYIDFTIPNSIFDLKYSDSANPDDFIKTISRLDYDLQAGAYVRGSVASGLFESEPTYHFLVYDKTGNYCVVELHYSYIRYGQRKLDYHIQALNRCVKENAWHQSYNFFKRKTRAYKPKWAKAYPLEGEETEVL